MYKLRASLLLAVLLDPVLSITFYLPVNSMKCLQENIRKDVLVSGHYEITDYLMDTLYTKENATKGKLSFITQNYEQFEVCFSSISTMGSTNTRLQLFSVISVCCFLALATWQILYLRRFFKTMKLIE